MVTLAASLAIGSHHCGLAHLARTLVYVDSPPALSVTLRKPCLTL
jgi:hypothetical protein